MRRPASSLAILVLAITACSSEPAGPLMHSPLDGLQESLALDSTGTLPPTPPLPTGDGQIRGTVLGKSSAAGDTLATSPRLAGAAIGVFPVVRTDPQETLGPEAASAVTGTDGKFTLPTLPTGQYVITIKPADADMALYMGQWIRTTIHSGSGDYPWWIVLAKR